MRIPLIALLAFQTLGGCIIYEKDVHVRHHDDECWDDPYGCGGSQPGYGGDQPSEGEGEGEGDGGEGEGEGDGGEGEGEDSGGADTGGADTGGADTGGEGEGEGEEEVAWSFWPNEILPGQTLLSSLTSYPSIDYALVADVQLFDGLEVCGFSTGTTEIFVAIAAAGGLEPGAADALVVLTDGTATFVPDAITILEGEAEGEGEVGDTGDGPASGCD